MHRKSKAGQPQTWSAQPIKSTDAKQCKPQCRISIRQLTPKAASPSPSPSPLLQRSGISAQGRKCGQDLSRCKPTSLQTRTTEDLASTWDSTSGLMYQTSSGNPTQTIAQDIQMQSDIFNPVAMQAMSLEGIPTQGNMDYDFQQPQAIPSALYLKPTHSVRRNPVQQTPVTKTERSPTLRTSWFPEASSSHHQPSSDASPFFQQGAHDVPMAFPLQFPTASGMQDNGLPITSSNPSQNSFSDDTIDDNNFRGGSLDLAYQLQPNGNYGSFPMDIDGQAYPGKFPFPPP